jgi:hypothetical protein
LTTRMGRFHPRHCMSVYVQYVRVCVYSVCVCKETLNIIPCSLSLALPLSVTRTSQHSGNLSHLSQSTTTPQKSDVTVTPVPHHYATYPRSNVSSKLCQGKSAHWMQMFLQTYCAIHSTVKRQCKGKPLNSCYLFSTFCNLKS